MTDSAAYIKTAFFLPTGTTAIKFSQIREMYGNEAGTDHASTTFSEYLGMPTSLRVLAIRQVVRRML